MVQYIQGGDNMGIYLNPDNSQFQEAVNKKIYVDKTLLIEKINTYRVEVNKYICMSRPRRFGKSTDANMLVAYYSKGCDSSDIFNHFKLSKTENYKRHLNKHNVIYINMQTFLSRTKNIDAMLERVNLKIIKELARVYIEYADNILLSDMLEELYAYENETFIFIIDEWDCIFREYQNNKEAQKRYLDFLRDLLKDQPYVSLAYMTGILPIKKYGTHSALNMFEEISMVDPGLYANFMGFTEEEVCTLCKEHDVSFDEMRSWYDGYHLTDRISTFSPRSVVMALTRKEFGNYWTSTETYEALKVYIDMNFDGLKDNIVQLLAEENIPVQTTSFQNDMTTFKSKDDVLTLLINLGYLGYNGSLHTCYIPNKEVVDSFVNSIRSSNWQETTKALLNSRDLLQATWRKDEKAVARYIEEAHLDTAILTYNNENALAYTLSLAYITAREHYTIIREMPAGKGFADLVFIPRYDKPAMIVELKWDRDVKTAITQIKEKKYPNALERYQDNLLIIGITYNKESKEHVCHIERITNKK